MMVSKSVGAKMKKISYRLHVVSEVDMCIMTSIAVHVKWL